MALGTLLAGEVYERSASAAFAGKDEPFCFDITAGTFVAITGTASANLPTTQATSGDWTPPTMDMVANRILVTHPGFTGSNKVEFKLTHGDTADGSFTAVTAADVQGVEGCGQPGPGLSC